MTEPTYDELKARLADLEKQVETKKRSGTMEFKVSEKGGVSVYGLGRFPVTLYYEHATSQWLRNLRASPDVQIRVADYHSRAHARVITGDSDPDLLRTVQQASREKYGWGEGVVVELAPVPDRGE